MEMDEQLRAEWNLMLHPAVKGVLRAFVFDHGNVITPELEEALLGQLVAQVINRLGGDTPRRKAMRELRYELKITKTELYKYRLAHNKLARRLGYPVPEVSLPDENQDISTESLMPDGSPRVPGGDGNG